MAHHLLSLEVPTVMNTCIMSVLDTSIYSPLMPVSCPTLNVTVPGFKEEIQFLQHVIYNYKLKDVMVQHLVIYQMVYMLLNTVCLLMIQYL